MRVFAQATNKSSYFADGTSGAAEGMDAAFHSFYHKFTHIRPEYGRMIFLHNCDAIDLGGRAVRVGSIEGLVRLLPYTSGMQQQAVFCGIGHFGTDTGPVEIVDSLKGAPLSVRRADSPIEEHLIRRALAANQVENALLLMVRSKKEDPDAVEGACVALASFYEQLSVVDHILSAFGEFGETEQDGKIFKRYLSNLALLYGYRGPFARNSPQFSQNPSKPGFPTGEPDGVRPPGIWGEIDDRLGAYVERHRGDEAKSFSLSYVIQCRRTLRDVSIQNYEFEDRQLGQAVEPK